VAGGYIFSALLRFLRLVRVLMRNTYIPISSYFFLSHDPFIFTIYYLLFLISSLLFAFIIYSFRCALITFVEDTPWRAVIFSALLRFLRVVRVLMRNTCISVSFPLISELTF
jgi:hypothetical protein